MGQVTRREHLRAEAQQGFTILEVIIAMGVLSVGLLSLVGVFAAGLQRVGASSNQLIAREKAREAIESVHAARDTGRLSWGNIRNVADGGIFAVPLKVSGTKYVRGIEFHPGNARVVHHANIRIDRKILADLSISDPAGFKAIAAQAGIKAQA